MTDAEAWALIKNSTVYTKAGGDFIKAWSRYAIANPNAADWLYAAAGGDVRPAVPSGVSETAFGRGMRHFAMKGMTALVALYREVVPPPVTPPPLPSTRAPFLSSMVVNASACSTELLERAGMEYASVEVNENNTRDFSTPRWQPFTKGWFLISRGNDGDYIAGLLDAINETVPFAIIDTESHKADMGGQMAWTETLYAACRSKVGPDYDLYNITFGIHSSPGVVNHDAFRRHNITPVWEAYDGDGNSLGARVTADKAIREGWNPAHIAIGDKTIREDAPIVKQLFAERKLGSCWVWAPEQAGVDVLALKDVLP